MVKLMKYQDNFVTKAHRGPNGGLTVFAVEMMSPKEDEDIPEGQCDVSVFIAKEYVSDQVLEVIERAIIMIRSGRQRPA